MLNKAKEILKKEIDAIEDIFTLEKIQIYLLGMKAQQNLTKSISNNKSA